MNFKKVLILCLLIIASKFYTQNIVSAKIEIDDYANLHINQKINFSIDTLRISKDILIHSRYAKLLRNESQNSISYMPKKIDSIFYTYSPPSKKSSSDYKITNDFLFTTAEFLALSKKNYSQKKKFDLEFISIIADDTDNRLKLLSILNLSLAIKRPFSLSFFEYKFSTEFLNSI